MARRFAILFTTILLLKCTGLAAAAPETGPTYTQILDLAHKQYASIFSKVTINPPKQFVRPIQRVINLLFARAGAPMVPYELRVINTEGLNASTTIGPYFTINLELLKAVEERAAQMERQAPQLGNRERIMETLIAGVLGHEMGHFLSLHGVKALQASYLSKENQERSAALEAIQHSQQEELEADQIAYQLMEAAGYGGENLYHALRLIHDDNQKNCNSSDSKRKARCSSYLYANTHPAMHERLLRFQNENTEYHARMLALELAVGRVAQGIELAEAITTLDGELKQNPQNLFLLQFKAYAHHKRWLATVPLVDQQLRVIIPVPAFYDKMAASRRGSRGSKEIPGDPALFFAAVKAYNFAIKAGPQPEYLHSAHAALIVYDPEQQDKAIEMNAPLIRTAPDTIILNNYAVVLTVAGKFDEASNVLKSLVVNFDPQYQGALRAAQQNPQAQLMLQQLHAHMKRMQVFDANYVNNDFTPLLNLAMLQAKTKNMELAQKLTQHYLSGYDRSSDWSKYLLKIAHTTATPPGKIEDIAISGLTPSAPSSEALKRFGKPTKKVAGTENSTIYYFDSSKVRVVTTALGVRGITVSQGSQVKINEKIGIGSTRGEVENLWGKSTRAANGYRLYGDVVVLGIRYEDDRVAEFTLQ